MLEFLGLDSISFWIIAVCVLVSGSCSIVGCFLVLRRMSLLGDAISHAVLPGLAIAFLVTESRAPLPMLLGAAAAGLVTVLLTQVTETYAKVPGDAALGVVFSSLFALGVVLITRAASHVDLDPGCVLYGVLEAVALDTYDVAGMEIPRVAVNLAVMLIVVVAFVTLLWKELKLVAFDPALATTLGYNAQLIHYLLMALTAAVTVTAFEAVGSILVVAMLIAPAAAAHLLTRRLSTMVLIAVVLGIVAAVAGRYAAFHYQTSVAGMMSVVAGALFLLAVIFAPHTGYLSRRLVQLRLALRVLEEDALGMLYRYQETYPDKPLDRAHVMRALHGGVLTRLALWKLAFAGAVGCSAEGLHLTGDGRTRAATIVRAHRLWETYLHKHCGIPLDHVHEPAAVMEHFLGGELKAQLGEVLGEPARDPHGRPLPGKNQNGSAGERG
jgi:manganese/zinc/iron transport system permease protein